MNLPVAANLAKVSLERISRAVIPFILAMVAALVVTIHWTSLSTWLPRLLGVG